LYPIIINKTTFRQGIVCYLEYKAAQLVEELRYMPECRGFDSP